MKNSIEKIYRFIQILGAYISGIAILAMMFLITADVFMKNIFSLPIQGSYEVTMNFLMPIAIFPALVFTYTSGIMPRFVGFSNKGPLAFRKFSAYSVLFIELLTTGMLAYYGFLQFLATKADKTGVSMAGNVIPIYPIVLIVPIGFGLTFFGILCSFYLKLNYQPAEK